MNTVVDFLPEAYRQRLAQRRTRRERMLLAVPIALAVLATDQVLRARVRIVQHMAEQAGDHAAQGEQRRQQVQQLAQRVADGQRMLAEWTLPMAAPRMTAVLDALLADRPDGITLHELTCRQTPWSSGPQPIVQINASAASADAFTAFLEHLQRQPELPPMQCQRTTRGDRDDGLAFHLESTPATAPPR